ncbi:MAG: AIM24 family protein [Clostridia bacterium]|nr:AIM24 family protein [Clostridia bacterium]
MSWSIMEGVNPILDIVLENAGDWCLAEVGIGTYLGSSPVFSQTDYNQGKPTGALRRSLATGAEISGTTMDVSNVPPWVAKRWRNKADEEFGKDLEAGGEKNFAIYQAMEPNQSISFGPCYPGVILPWDCGNYGLLRAVKGAFLAGYNITVGTYSIKDTNVVTQSGTKGQFQEFSGNGMVFLEVHGIAKRVELGPNESYDITPGHLLAFTEDVKLSMKNSGEMRLRIAENSSSLIRATAGGYGGIVYLCSGSPKEFWKSKPKDD